MEVSNELLMELLEDKVRLSIFKDAIRTRKRSGDKYMMMDDIEAFLGREGDTEDEN